ncbi:MAG: RNA polymerase subunit sigma-70 [Phycisphaerae bacterium]|nr:RNA polymerase subunit sigma-70 [Phycisphaerae bacterium]
MTDEARRTTDEALFEAYRKGNEEALETLVERHHDHLVRFLYRMLGDRQAVDDVFQDAFLQVHLRSHTFDATRRFRPWLFTIAANKARDYLRSRTRRRSFEVSVDVPIAGRDGSVSLVDLLEGERMSPDAGMSAEERDRMVQSAIDSLSPTLRESLLLAYFQRLTYAQIADELGIPLGTVKSRLHAAVAGFAKRWRELSAKEAGVEARERDGGAA